MPTHRLINPLGIPDLNPMLNSVLSLVTRHQNGKGYINTQGRARIVAYEHINGTEIIETNVKAVRVSGTGTLEVLTDHPNIPYADRSIIQACAHDDLATPRGGRIWAEVSDENRILFVPTIFSIAERITAYVN